MSLRLIRLSLCACVLCAAAVACVPQQSVQRQPAPASVQPAARPSASQQRAAAIKRQNQALLGYAQRIAHRIDLGQIGQVWDAASPVAKRTVPRTRFIEAIRANRQRLGSVVQRRAVRITRTDSKGRRGLPAGHYINVTFETKFSARAQPVHELMSFHFDRDHRWRLAGYDIR